MSESRQQSSHRTRKIAAIAAGLLVVGVGATYTLASWTDSEWVWGGAGNGEAIGTSSFNVQQNTTAPFNNDGLWTDEETNSGGELNFSLDALSLVPGDSVYAPVALRTEADSDAAIVTLQAAGDAAGSESENLTNEALWNAIRVSVYTQEGTAPSPACAAGIESDANWEQIVTDAVLATEASAQQNLLENSGSVQHYCFVLTLPTGSSNDLQGMTIAPAWEFKADSN